MKNKDEEITIIGKSGAQFKIPKSKLKEIPDSIFKESFAPYVIDNSGNLRFVKGSIDCQNCNSSEELIHYIIDRIVKDLPIQENIFLCRLCAIKFKLPMQEQDEN